MVVHMYAEYMYICKVYILYKNMQWTGISILVIVFNL